VYNGLAKELRLFRRRGLASGEAMDASNREHRAIVEAIAAGNPTTARRCAAEHLRRGAWRLQEGGVIAAGATTAGRGRRPIAAAVRGNGAPEVAARKARRMEVQR